MADEGRVALLRPAAQFTLAQWAGLVNRYIDGLEGALASGEFADEGWADDCWICVGSPIQPSLQHLFSHLALREYRRAFLWSVNACFGDYRVTNLDGFRVAGVRRGPSPITATHVSLDTDWQTRFRATFAREWEEVHTKDGKVDYGD